MYYVMYMAVKILIYESLGKDLINKYGEDLADIVNSVNGV